MKPLIEDSFDAGDIVIGTPIPPEINVDYLQEVRVPIYITNKTEGEIIVDKIALQFHVAPEASGWTDGLASHTCEGAILNPKASRYWNVTVKPNLFFNEYTNFYSVTVAYRKRIDNELTGVLTAKKSAGEFLIIKRAPSLYGTVFISYKDSEDIDLAKGLFSLAQRAGFEPYMAPPDIKPGLPIWEKKIQPMIKKCSFAFIIWTDETAKGPGVAREVQICRRYRRQEVLLLQKGIPVPQLFNTKRRRDRERVSFERSSAFQTFADVVVARRKMIENG